VALGNMAIFYIFGKLSEKMHLGGGEKKEK